MKKLLFVLFVLITGVASGQGNSVKPRTKTISIGGGYYLVQDLTPIIGYTRIFARYEWNSGAFDSTLYAPRYNGVPTGARVNENSDIDGKLAVDTANHRLYFYSGGSWRYSTAGTSGGTPTWQQTLAAGSTLTTDNTINSNGYDFAFNGQNIQFSASDGVDLTATLLGNTSNLTVDGSQIVIRNQRTGASSYFDIRSDSLLINPHLGYLVIDTIPNISTQNTLLGWKQGTGQGQVGYVTLGSGLSLSSGVLNTSGTVATPISSLTAATGTNSIDNTTFQQNWSWTNVVTSGLVINSTSTAAPSGTTHRVFAVNASGANSNSAAQTSAIAATNTHTGTTSLNYGFFGTAQDGVTNIGGSFNGAKVTNGTTNIGVQGTASGTGTTNTGGSFSATGGTTNIGISASADQYAIIVPASSGSVGIGTSTPTEILHVVGNIKGTNYIELTDVSAPSTPASGFGRIYVRADSLRFKNDGGTEFTMGTGGGVTGSGTTNYLPKWTGASALGNSGVYDDGTNVGIGTTSPSSPLQVKGTGSSTGAWKGRIVAGGDNVAFLLGEYNSQAWLGAHNAALSAWASIYINPDGGAATFIGPASAPVLTVNNTGTSVVTYGNTYLSATTGSVSVGHSSPSAKLHIAAGTASASTAPLKLTTGTSLTTAEAGAFEYTTPQLFFTNGAAVRQEIPQIQQARVSTQYDNTTTTLGTVTGLTTNVAAGKTYRFEAILYTTSDGSGGVKFAMSGTATATNIIYEAVVFNAGSMAAQTRATALATTVGAVTAVTNAYTKITGTITVNAAGTFLVQAAANAATGTTSVLVGSTFVITEML